MVTNVFTDIDQASSAESVILMTAFQGGKEGQGREMKWPGTGTGTGMEDQHPLIALGPPPPACKRLLHDVHQRLGRSYKICDAPSLRFCLFHAFKFCGNLINYKFYRNKLNKIDWITKKYSNNIQCLDREPTNRSDYEFAYRPIRRSNRLHCKSLKNLFYFFFFKYTSLVLRALSKNWRAYHKILLNSPSVQTLSKLFMLNIYLY